ncbi:hypothetical protein EZS27_041106, partial [termite gut metagenome]
MKRITFFILLCSGISFGLKATPYNIAPQAKATASSEFSDAYRSANVCDGIIGIADRGEWASKSTVNGWGGIDYPY